MAANPDDPHYSVGMADALAGKNPYQFQDAVHQARYDRGYAEGEMQQIADEYGRRAQQMPQRLTAGLTGWTFDAFEQMADEYRKRRQSRTGGFESFDAFEQRMRARRLGRG